MTRKIWKPEMSDRGLENHPLRHSSQTGNYKQIIEKMEINENIRGAFSEVDRNKFISGGGDYSRDAPAYIPEGQTTSQPSYIAFMLHVLDLKEGERLGEVGAGSGFLLALGHRITKCPVHGFETKPGLVRVSQNNLNGSYENKDYVKNNFKIQEVPRGYNFAKHKNKFDAVVVSAGLSLDKNDNLPDTLEELQEIARKNKKIRDISSMLKKGGRLAIPVGKKSGDAVVGKLCFLEKAKNGELKPAYIENKYLVQFVPLI